MMMLKISTGFCKAKIALVLLLVVFAAGLTGCATGHSDGPGEATRIYREGVRLIKSQQYSGAKERFHHYVAQYPGTELYVVSLYYLGVCYQQLGDDKQAELIFHRVVAEEQDGFWADMARTRLQVMKDK